MMIVYPLRSRYWLLAEASTLVLSGAVALILIVGPSGSGRLAGVVAGLAVAVAGGWFVWSLRRRALILDGDRLGRRSGLRAQCGHWIDLDDVRLISDAPMASSVTRQRRDALLWTSSRVDSRWSASLTRRLMVAQQRDRLIAVEARGDTLYPFVVPCSTLREVDVNELRATLSPLLKGVPDVRSTPSGPAASRSD
jgi:hypothetical protein